VSHIYYCPFSDSTNPDFSHPFPANAFHPRRGVQQEERGFSHLEIYLLVKFEPENLAGGERIGKHFKQ
jgi:hypothetical protein